MSVAQALTLAAGIGCMGSSALADVYYYSATGYSDEARTVELFTVTARVENQVTGVTDPPNPYVYYGNIYEFQFTWTGESSPTATSDVVYYQQEYTDPPGFGGQSLFFKESKFGREVELYFDWTSTTDAYNLQLFSNLESEGQYNPSGGDPSHDVYIWTTQSMEASLGGPVPGPGVAMLVGIGGFAIGGRRRRR